jgi:hypothetical protein
MEEMRKAYDISVKRNVNGRHDLADVETDNIKIFIEGYGFNYFRLNDKEDKEGGGGPF